MNGISFVARVQEIAAANPKARAIVAHLKDPAQARAAQEAFGALFVQGDLPPVLIFDGDVGLAEQKGGEANVGLFIGMTELAKLLAMEGEEIKEALLDLVGEI